MATAQILQKSCSSGICGRFAFSRWPANLGIIGEIGITIKKEEVRGDQGIGTWLQALPCLRLRFAWWVSVAIAADAARLDTPGKRGLVTMGGFKNPPSGPGPVLRDPKFPRVTNDDLRATGAQPTFAMGDVTSPILQPWAADVLRKHNELVLSGKPAFPRNASCYPAGVPGFLLYPVQPVYFIQSPKEVSMVWQADHQLRHVYLTDKHSQNVKTSWYGESIGQYEGDTLVVDTIGVDDRTVVDGFQTATPSSFTRSSAFT
jgi:hypothetical protein